MDIYTRIPVYTLFAVLLFLLWRLIRSSSGGAASSAGVGRSILGGLGVIGRGLRGVFHYWQVPFLIVGTLVSAWCFAKAGVINMPLMKTVPNKWAYGLAGAVVLLLSIIVVLNFREKPHRSEGHDDDHDHKKKASDPRFRKLAFFTVVGIAIVSLAHLFMELNGGGGGTTLFYVIVVIACAITAIALEDSAMQLLYLIILAAIASGLHVYPVLELAGRVDHLPPGQTYVKVANFAEDVEADVKANREGFAHAVINVAHIAQRNHWKRSDCEVVYRWLVEDGAGYTVAVREDPGAPPINWCGLICNLGIQIDDLTLPTDFPDLRDPEMLKKARTKWIEILLANKQQGIVKLIEDPWAVQATCEPEPEGLG